MSYDKRGNQSGTGKGSGDSIGRAISAPGKATLTSRLPVQRKARAAATPTEPGNQSFADSLVGSPVQCDGQDGSSHPDAQSIALAFIADPSSVETFAAHVADADGRIRGNAANGLAQLRDPRALDALINTLNDYPALNQYPSTLSTAGLIELGRAALPRLGPLLSSPDVMTRVRASYVLQNIVTAMPGEDWPARWRALGSYVATSTDDDARERAAEMWRAWIAALPGAGA